MFRVIYLFYILHYLKNWRPISLLNCDYEIAAKVIASRIKTVLSTIINFDQTGFLKGRSIGENVRLIDSIINFYFYLSILRKLLTPGVVLYRLVFWKDSEPYRTIH